MASITIRNISDDLKKRLRKQAAENGRSMEAEAREILIRALHPSTELAPSSRDLESGSVLHGRGMAEDKQPFRASDKPPLPKGGIAESMRRRFAPFGGVELEPFPDEVLEAPRPPRKTRKK